MEFDKVVGTGHIIYQDEDEFKYTTDSLILSSFVGHGKRVLDLGSGTGIISLRVEDRFKEVYSVEKNQKVLECFKRSVLENNLQEKINIIDEDIYNLKNIFKTNYFDNIVMNPPFYDYENIKFDTTVAKHGFSLDEALDIIKYLLKNSGTLTMIYPTFRLAEAIYKINENSMRVKSIVNIHNEAYKSSKSSIIIAKKQANYGNTLREFYVRCNGEYSHEMKKVYENEVLLWFIFAQHLLETWEI